MEGGVGWGACLVALACDRVVGNGGAQALKKEAEARRAAALAERLTKIREEVDMQPRAKPSKQRGERDGEFDDFIDENAARERLDQKKRPKDRKRQRYGGEDEVAVLEGIRVFLAPSDDEGGEAEVDPEASPRPPARAALPPTRRWRSHSGLATPNNPAGWQRGVGGERGRASPALPRSRRCHVNVLGVPYPKIGLACVRTRAHAPMRARTHTGTHYTAAFSPPHAVPASHGWGRRMAAAL